jgi:endonuclease/exonuclease/phosphatase family metal-dependent hydrolase
MRLLLPLLSVLFATAAVAQDVPSVGTAATFDVATWNIEDFDDSDGAQYDNALAVIGQADIDLWALQEINSQFAFNNLIEDLGAGWEGTWTNGSGPLGYGYIWRTDVVQDLQATTVLTDFSYEFASRPPLLLRANITLPDTTVSNLRLLDIHAKCCSDSQSYQRRVAASVALKNYVDQLLTVDAEVMVLGDFNDELRNSIAGGPSPYQNFRDDAEDYTFVSYPLDLANVPTFCSNQSCTAGSTLDHILLTRTLVDDYEPSSIERFDELLEAFPQYVNETSDHLPVYARFDFAPVTTAAEDGALPQTFALHAPYPNPFRDATTLTYALPEPADVRLEVFDALGRRVATVAEGARAAGTHEVRFVERDLAPGLYLVRLTAGAQTSTRRLVHVP